MIFMGFVPIIIFSVLLYFMVTIITLNFPARIMAYLTPGDRISGSIFPQCSSHNITMIQINGGGGGGC